MSEEDRRLVERSDAEWDRRMRENDFNHAPHVREKAMGFEGDTIIVWPGQPTPESNDHGVDES